MRSLYFEVSRWDRVLNAKYFIFLGMIQFIPEGIVSSIGPNLRRRGLSAAGIFAHGATEAIAMYIQKGLCPLW